MYENHKKMLFLYHSFVLSFFILSEKNGQVFPVVSRLYTLVHSTFKDKGKKAWGYDDKNPENLSDRKPGAVLQDCLVDLCLCCTACVECNETVSSEEDQFSKASRREEEDTPRHFPQRQTSRMYDESMLRHHSIQTRPSRTIIISEALEDQVLRKQKRYSDSQKPPYSKHKWACLEQVYSKCIILLHYQKMYLPDTYLFHSYCVRRFPQRRTKIPSHFSFFFSTTKNWIFHAEFSLLSWIHYA